MQCPEHIYKELICWWWGEGGVSVCTSISHNQLDPMTLSIPPSSSGVLHAPIPPLLLDNNVSYLSLFSSMFFADTSLPKTVLNLLVPCPQLHPQCLISLQQMQWRSRFQRKVFPTTALVSVQSYGRAPQVLQQCTSLYAVCVVCSVLGKRQCWTWWAWWLGRDHARSHPGSHVQGEDILQQHHRHPHQHHRHHYLTNLKSKNIAKIAKVP